MCVDVNLMSMGHSRCLRSTTDAIGKKVSILCLSMCCYSTSRPICQCYGSRKHNLQPVGPSLMYFAFISLRRTRRVEDWLDTATDQLRTNGPTDYLTNWLANQLISWPIDQLINWPLMDSPVSHDFSFCANKWSFISGEIHKNWERKDYSVSRRPAVHVLCADKGLRVEFICSRDNQVSL